MICIVDLDTPNSSTSSYIGLCTSKLLFNALINTLITQNDKCYLINILIEFQVLNHEFWMSL